jgi:hypothetical protein
MKEREHKTKDEAQEKGLQTLEESEPMPGMEMDKTPQGPTTEGQAPAAAIPTGPEQRIEDETSGSPAQPASPVQGKDESLDDELRRIIGAGISPEEKVTQLLGMFNRCYETAEEFHARMITSNQDAILNKCKIIKVLKHVVIEELHEVWKDYYTKKFSHIHRRNIQHWVRIGEAEYCYPYMNLGEALVLRLLSKSKQRTEADKIKAYLRDHGIDFDPSVNPVPSGEVKAAIKQLTSAGKPRVAPSKMAAGDLADILRKKLDAIRKEGGLLESEKEKIVALMEAIQQTLEELES